MPQHSIADAFLSQFPKGVNPLLDVVKSFQGMQEAHAAQEKQKKQQLTPPPQSLQTSQASPAQQSLPPSVPSQPIPQGQSKVLQNLLRLGIPIGAAVAGSVNPNILPQAAGLATGFTEEITRQDEQRTKLGVRAEKKKEVARKESRQDRKDIRKEAERSVDKSVEFIPDTATRQRRIDELEEAILKARGLSPSQQARRTVEANLPTTGLRSFKTEAEARKAGFKSGDRVNIGGIDGALD